MTPNNFALSVLRPGAPERHVPFDGATATAWAITAKLAISGKDLRLSISGHGQAAVTLWLQPSFTDPFPFIPGFMLGYNRPEDTGPYYPQMTDELDLNPPHIKSPYWGIRADRATAPVIFIFGSEGMRALAVPPYVHHTPGGLRVCKKRGIGITIGHIVEPVQYICEGSVAPAYRGYHNFDGELTVPGHYFESDSGDRRSHAEVIKFLYSRYHEAAPLGEGVHKTVQLLADALVKDVLIPSQTELRDTFGGELFKIKNGKTHRVISEIGWTGGSMAAYPFLAMQKRYAKPELRDYAVRRLDRICDSVNPASGFFWDCQDQDGRHCRGWWTPRSPQAHYAYTQGHACYYLLKSSQLMPQRADCWIAAAKDVLDRVLELQLDNGQFPVRFSINDGSPESTVGFAGCWFAAALAWLGKITSRQRYLDAAIAAAEGYHRDVAALMPCGTPMDTHDAADQEGNLALLHTLAKLHELTGQARLLDMLRDSADYEMSWRYYYNTHPVIPPLTTAHWGSSGGSVTSAHNPHIHPMHLNSLDQVLYLYDRTAEQYYLDRTRDAVRYGCCCVCRPGEDFGWGRPGWLCERFCPSDGLLIQPDLRTGQPCSVGCDYHAWNVAVTVEGFTGQTWDRFVDL